MSKLNDVVSEETLMELVRSITADSRYTFPDRYHALGRIDEEYVETTSAMEYVESTYDEVRYRMTMCKDDILSNIEHSEVLCQEALVLAKEAIHLAAMAQRAVTLFKEMHTNALD